MGNSTNAQRWYLVPWSGGSSAEQEISNYGRAGMTAGRRSRSDGYYEIINKNSGLALDVAGGLGKIRTNVQLYQNLDENNKKWLIRSCGNGYFNVISKCNGLYLDLEDAKTDNGANVQMYIGWGINGAECQQWRFIPWGKSIGQTIEEGEYYIVPQTDDSKALSVPESETENEIYLEMDERREDDRSVFHVAYLGKGYYNIRNKNTNLSLEVSGSESGSKIQFGERGIDRQQLWMIEPCGDGSYNVISNDNGLYLDWGNITDRANIRLWYGNGGTLQKWKFPPNGRKMEEEATCSHSYQTSVTPATVKNNGGIAEKCIKCGDEKSKTVIYAVKTVALSKTFYTYNGKVQKPAVTVRDSSGQIL